MVTNALAYYNAEFTTCVKKFTSIGPWAQCNKKLTNVLNNLECLHLQTFPALSNVCVSVTVLANIKI